MRVLHSVDDIPVPEEPGVTFPSIAGTKLNIDLVCRADIIEYFLNDSVLIILRENSPSFTLQTADPVS